MDPLQIIKVNFFGAISSIFVIGCSGTDDESRTFQGLIGAYYGNDGREFDLGYTRSVQREDGKIVTIYYISTEDNYEQHIEATIWDPDVEKMVL